MNISIIICLIILILYFLCFAVIPCKKEKRKSLFLKLSFIALFIVLALRKPFSDMIYYLQIFHYFDGSIAKIATTRYDLLYKLLNIIVGKIWLNDRFFMFVVDAITLVGPYYIIKKYSKNYLLSVLLFVAVGTYYMQFYVIRQALAISFLLFSIKFIDEKKIFKFTILVIIATLFHKSAFVFWPMYFLGNLETKKVNMVIWFLLFILVFALKDQMAMLSLSSTDYSSYIDTAYNVSGVGYEKLLLCFAIIFFCLYFKENFDTDRISSIMLNFMYICIILQIVATSTATMVRLANYFYVPFYILLPNVISNFENKNTKLATEMLIILGTFIFVYIISPILGYEIMF